MTLIHGNVEGRITGIEEVLRQPIGFAAKDKPVFGSKGKVGVAVLTPNGKTEQSSPLGRLLPTKGLKVLMVVQLNVGPIVEARPFEITIAQFKAEGPHQMEGGLGGGAGAGHITGVGGDFGFY